MSLCIAMVAACPYPVPQGSQVLLQSTALALRALGHDVHLVVYGYGAHADDSGLTVHRAMNLPGARKTAAGPSPAKPFQDWALVRALRGLVARMPIDIVHAHNYEGLLVALAAGKRPIVYHAHNAMGEELPHFIAGTGWVGRALDRSLPRRADHVVAPHRALQDYLLTCGCRPDAVTVVPPSVDAAAFQADVVADARPSVVYTGNLDAYQNLGLLRRAMERVRESEPCARVIVATADARGADWAETVSTPDLPSLRAVLARDVIVACPRISWSGYPMKILNAMAAGKAVVACRGAAHPLEHERTGLVVQDDDTDNFAGALLRLMRDAPLRQALGTAAREAVLRDHAPPAMGRRLEEVYAAALTARRSPR